MLADIISIGDELLIGQVVNTNASWLAVELNAIGIGVQRIVAVSDNPEDITEALENSKTELVIVTGGLGPTSDDRTRQVIADFFNTPLVFSNLVFKRIDEYFKIRGRAVTEINRLQAMVPEAAVLLENNAGTAPGMWFDRDGKIFVFLPGVPFEMKRLFYDEVAGRLTELAPENKIIHRTILTEGIGESFLAERISKWESELPQNISLAYLPQPGIVRLRLSAVGNDENQLSRLLNDYCSSLEKLISDYIFGYDDDKLEDICGRMLKSKDLSLSTAESCTGGYLAHLITTVPGSSEYFKGSVVAYANEIKMNVLNVPADIIEKHGAVSMDTVCAMAEGVKKLTGSSYALAISGVAGPAGGTAEKPVGLVWIAVSGEKGTYAKKFLFGNDRLLNIQRSAIAALGMLYKDLKKL